jgi:anaerobic selenocysteine-containing dehydrogenase
MSIHRLLPEGGLTAYPPQETWDDWREYDAKQWPKRVEKRYMLVPTICFNCEAACGLLAWIDKDTLRVRKFEGNPLHPASRGRNCAKGPATINQLNDPERILYPLRRSGKRGDGQWRRVSWSEVLDEIGGRIRQAFLEGRRNEVMYHVGRPGHERAMDRVLKAWGIDGHNSHTNVCSASARLGYALWSGYDRPSPDHANARFILLLSSHLEAGHYFNPHAQRIIDGKLAGAKLAVIDPRLSNTASQADYWLPTYPGSEAAVLLAMAKLILDEGLADLAYLERWTNWREWMEAKHPGAEPRFASFVEELKLHYAEFTPEFAEAESGVAKDKLVTVARLIGRARGAFASHVWRGSASGNLGGWQVARALQLLTVLTASVGTAGGTSPHAWNKYKPVFWKEPPPQQDWNELLFPREWPLSHYEMSYLLPHFLKEGRGKLDVYFTRVYNPVWTNPDGMTWIDVLRDESLIGLHAALTPVWNETAIFADFVLPMGMAGERHDIQSQETHSGRWVSYRQPVLRAARERMGERFRFTYEANPGEVWEEDEFWIELSWRIDPDGALGIRSWFESPYQPGEKLTVEEYYRWLFENAVPGLPDAAAKAGLAPLEYMRRNGAFLIEDEVRELHQVAVKAPAGASPEAGTGIIRSGGKAVGVEIDGKAVAGFPTPSRKLEIFSRTLSDWGWPEEALPGYIRSHVHPQQLDAAKGELVLLPTFRLPTLIHTRSGNTKYLNEISHRNPLWISPHDARLLGIATGELVRVTTEIGYFVNRAWVTEGIAPHVVACSHHMGRWRLREGEGSRWTSARVSLTRKSESGYLLRQLEGLAPFKSEDPDSQRIWWSDGGVHQNLTFPVQPDPVSGMHCWHQKVTVQKAPHEDRYGDVFVDTARSMEVYRRWLATARPGPGPGGLRRPLWLDRPLRPADEAFYVR